jgi:arylsulfatase|tara:strand:- start:878 stop:3745 length:2868 start_codon:yes stop_codon:yes gene_type:complete
MSGLRPSTTGVYENGTPLQLQMPKGHLTLPQFFRESGYLTHGGGKIYHDQIGFNVPEDWDEFYLWNESYRRFAWECGYSRKPDPEPVKRPMSGIARITKRNFDFGAVVEDESAMPDYLSTSDAVEFLSGEHEKPFFLAVGQFRPHVPWFVPRKYFDLYPLGEIVLPVVKAGDVDDLPEIAKKRAKDPASKHQELLNLGEWKRAVQGYLASISFADSQVGRVLDALEESGKQEETMIVFWSDHGYHLGEKEHWHKRTLWERSTRVPYVVVAPGVTTPGSVCDQTVDLMSIYPTLVELSGGEVPKQISGEGRSVISLLKDVNTEWDGVALTTHRRGNHAVRTDRHRYIRYQDGSEELYDHSTDPHEWRNLAGRSENRKLMNQLAKHMPRQEAEEGPSYYSGEALIRLKGESYEWGRKSEVKGEDGWQNAAKLKSKAWKAAAKPKPNIVLVVADDLGFSDLGCYGSEIRTPVLDGLAEQGVRYLQFYNATRCCPSRACLLTGKYPHQAGVGHMTYDAGEPGYRGELRADVPTVAEVLKKSGYFTVMSGKWHVTPEVKADGERGNWPCQRGFDEFFGTLAGHGSFWDPKTLMRNNEPAEAGRRFFYTDAIAEKAVEMVKKAGEKPFFLYVPFTAPHYPIHAREETIASYGRNYEVGWDEVRGRRHARLLEKGMIQEGTKLAPRDPSSVPWEEEKNQAWQAHRMAVYAAMVTEMDTAIGVLIEGLMKQGKWEETVFVFVSDNGGSNEGHLNNTIERMKKPWVSSMVPEKTPDGRPVRAGDWVGERLGGSETYGSYGPRWANVSNTPFRKHKSWLHEGGISTPCIVVKPGGKSGVNHEVRHLVDLMPTLLDLAGVKGVETEGVSLLERVGERELGWEHEGNRAYRKGKWKIVSEFPGTWTTMYPYEKKGAWELYDMEKDRSELNDLAGVMPEKVGELMKGYGKWATRVGVVEWSQLEGRKE